MALFLFTAFHGNLLFSSLPVEQVPCAVDRCYRPLVELAKSGFKLGLEMPASTLEIINDIDPSLVADLRGLCAEGRIELIGSGHTQTIFPLIPADSNRRNLDLGNRIYRDLLGISPSTAYVNEQAFSYGLADLYIEAGFERIIMEHENPASHRPELKGIGLLPAVLKGSAGQSLGLLWNSSIAFQKFQRAVQEQEHLNLGDPLKDGAEDFVDWILGHRRAQDRCLCLYGSDLEVLGFRPGGLNGRDGLAHEWSRIEEIFKRLAEHGDVVIATPREVALALADQAPIIAASQLVSAEAPIPVKKQEKYNVTRWAVSGRDDARLSAHCLRLERDIAELRCLAKISANGGGPTIERLGEEAVALWASDLRTNTTDEKFRQAYMRLGAARAEAEKLRIEMLDQLSADPVIIDVSEAGIDGPVQIPVKFKPGQWIEPPRLLVDGAEVPCQLDDMQRYSDGSIRSAMLAARLKLGPGQALPCAWARGGVAPRRIEEPCSRIETDSVSLDLERRKGGTIRSLRFPAVCDSPMIGLLPHGYFDHVELAYDLFSGHMILVLPNGQQATDLGPCEPILAADPETCPVRVPIQVRLNTEIGPVEKLYQVYRGSPRVDITYSFAMREARPQSFRLMATLRPEAFDRETMHYAARNGGLIEEQFELTGRRVDHGAAVDGRVSARTGVGGTDGYLRIGDSRRGVAFIVDRRQLGSIFMVTYREVGDRFFARASVSLAESDETSAGIWRGQSSVGVAFFGYTDPMAVGAAARAFNAPPMMAGSGAR